MRNNEKDRLENEREPQDRPSPTENDENVTDQEEKNEKNATK